MAGLVLALLGSPASAAFPEESPRARVVYRSDVIQHAKLSAWCWPGSNGGMGCGQKEPLPWPRADVLGAGSRLRVRIGWRREPRRIHVDSYRSVRDNGQPRDRGKDLFFRKEPVIRDGRTVAWDIVFRVHAIRHHYLKVLAHFNEGTLVWNAHVRAID